MAPNKNQKMKTGNRPQHLFKSVRDPVVVSASGGAAAGMASMTTDSSGNAQYTTSFAPLGYNGITTSNAVAGSKTVFSSQLYQFPSLPWLYNQARNFERYRVLRAVLIAVGNLGSGATGRMLLDSSTDVADNASVISTSTSTGGKVFDVGSLANKEARFQLDVDTSWKKVSAQTYSITSDGAVCCPISTANDLSFTNVYFKCIGVSASSAAPVAGTIVAEFYMEYDVEFRDPISYAVNV
jgi:hypothetical protein